MTTSPGEDEIMRIAQCIVFGLALALAAPACGGDSDGGGTTGGGGDPGDGTVLGDDAGSGDDASGPTTNDGGETCEPACDDLDCGDDGCGGSCGDCVGEDTCDAGVCTPPVACVPDCEGKACGDDGCDGSCGTCSEGVCSNSTCCIPDCGDKVCGNFDGCGGSCGTCGADEQCNAGVCEGQTYSCSEGFSAAQQWDSTTCELDATALGCISQCPEGDAPCGDDGCGGSCGTCDESMACNAAGSCVVVEDCTDTCESVGASCDTVCGEACGDCSEGSECVAGSCQCPPGSVGPPTDDTQVEAFQALWTCIEANECSGAQTNAQTACQKDDCLAETASCEASQYGDLMCFEITQCLADATCPKDMLTGAPTAACRRHCLEQGTETAVLFWLDLELCGLSECLGEADFDQCVTDVSGLQCVTEYGDCYDEAQQ